MQKKITLLCISKEAARFVDFRTENQIKNFYKFTELQLHTEGFKEYQQSCPKNWYFFLSVNILKFPIWFSVLKSTHQDAYF